MAEQKESSTYSTRNQLIYTQYQAELMKSKLYIKLLQLYHILTFYHLYVNTSNVDHEVSKSTNEYNKHIAKSLLLIIL